MAFRVTYYDPTTGQEIDEGTLPDGPHTLKLWDREVPIEINGDTVTIFRREDGIGKTIPFGFELPDIVDSVTITPREGPLLWIQSNYSESRRLRRVGPEG